MNTLDLSDIDSYIAYVYQLPILTREQEKKLIIKKIDGDINAYNKLVECNLRRVVIIAKKYSQFGFPLEDLIQEGNIGLLYSVNTFNDPDANLNNYIERSIEWHMRTAIKKYSGIDITYKVADEIQEMCNVCNRYVIKMGIEPSNVELEDLFNLDLEEFKKLRDLIPSTPESVEELIELESQGNEKDFVYDRDFDINDDIYRTEISGTIKCCIEHLTDMQKFAVKYHYGLIDGNCYTLDKIADMLGIHRQSVSGRLQRSFRNMTRRLKYKDHGEFAELYGKVKTK